MNALTVTPFEAYRQKVLPPDKAADLYRALPAHIKPEVFERNLLNALMQNPKLMDYDARLVYREVCKAAAVGLLLDPQLREAWIVPGSNGPQLRVGYVGMCKLARQTGEVDAVYPHEVCAKDRFLCRLGTNKCLEHEPPPMFAERGPVVGYYAVIKLKGGEPDFELMSVADVHRIRDRTDAWRAFTAGKIKSTPWGTDEVEMAKKTVLRRLLKRQPQSPELARALDMEDEADYPELRNVTPTLTPSDENPPGPDEVDGSAPAPKAKRTPKPKPDQPATNVVTGEPSRPLNFDAVATVEAGRDDGKEVVWSDDEPPPPDAVEGDIPGFLQRSDPAIPLFDTIAAVKSVPDLTRLANDRDYRDKRDALSLADQGRVHQAFQKRLTEIRPA